MKQYYTDDTTLSHIFALMQNRTKYSYLPLLGPAIECLKWDISVSGFFRISI